jgi:hypothetical protein
MRCGIEPFADSILKVANLGTIQADLGVIACGLNAKRFSAGT